MLEGNNTIQINILLSTAMHQSLATSCHSSATDRGQDSALKIVLMPYCVPKLQCGACGDRLHAKPVKTAIFKKKKRSLKMTHAVKALHVVIYLFIFIPAHSFEQGRQDVLDARVLGLKARDKARA